MFRVRVNDAPLARQIERRVTDEAAARSVEADLIADVRVLPVARRRTPDVFSARAGSGAIAVAKPGTLTVLQWSSQYLELLALRRHGTPRSQQPRPPRRLHPRRHHGRGHLSQAPGNVPAKIKNSTLLAGVLGLLSRTRYLLTERSVSPHREPGDLRSARPASLRYADGRLNLRLRVEDWPRYAFGRVIGGVRRTAKR